MSTTDRKNITIILADDHPVIRKGLKDIIEDQLDCSIIGEASDGAQAIELVEQLQPSIVIVDVDMPKLNGLEVARAIRERKLPVQVIVLTMYDKESIFNRAMDLGARGYILKDSALTEIIDAIRRVTDNKYYISPSISGFLVKRSGYESSEADVTTGISRLTATERKILKMVAENHTTRDIADELFISFRTVERHRSNICQKLNIHGTNALLYFALEHRDVL